MILRSLARQVQDTDGALPDALSAYEDAMANGVKGGRLVESTSQNGHSTKFRVPVIGEHFRQEDIAELAGEFQEVYADARSSLVASGNSNPDDATILAVMMADDRMQSIKVTRRDYTLINYLNRF